MCVLDFSITVKVPLAARALWEKVATHGIARGQEDDKERKR
jgi:hypothetical protein